MGKGKKKKWCRKCCLFWRGGLVGKVFGGGGGGVLLDLEVETQSPVFMGVFVERKERLLL